MTADGLAQHSMRVHLGLVLLLSLAQQQQRARAQDAAADRTITLRVDSVAKLARGDVAPWDDSWTTFALTAVLPPSAANLYEIFGTDEHPLSFPPAWQAFAPWAQDVGGALTAANTWTNPPTVGGLVLPRDQMCSACGCACGYDSWLTVGIIEGDATHQLQATGIDFTPNFVDRGWFLNEQTLAGHGIDAPSGSVAWGDPARAPGNSDAQHGGVQIAQMTVPTGSQWSVLVNLRGLTAEGTTWEVHGVEITEDGSPVVPIPGPAPEPEPEPELGAPAFARPPPPPPRPTPPPPGQCESSCIYGRSCSGWSHWSQCFEDANAGTAVDGPTHGGVAADGLPSGHARVGYQVAGASCTQSRTCRRNGAVQKQDCGVQTQPFGVGAGEECQSSQQLNNDGIMLPPPPPPPPGTPRQSCADAAQLMGWFDACPRDTVAFYNRREAMPPDLLCATEYCGQAVSDWAVCCSYGGARPPLGPPAPEPEPEPAVPAGGGSSGPNDCEGFWSDWVGCGAHGEFHGGACETNLHCCLPQWEQTFTVTRRATAGGRSCAVADGARQHVPCVGNGATQEADVCSPWPACAAALPVPSGCTVERVAAAVALSSSSSTTPAAGSGH